MNFLFDPLNLVLLGVVLFILWRLRGVLGIRTGNERPPFDPYSARPKDAPRPVDAANTNAPRLPQPAGEERPRPAIEPPPPVWTGVAAEGSPMAAALEKLAAAEPGFSPRKFLDGAKLAYEMIVEAFAKGDKQALKPLLSRDVLAGFSSAIDARNAAGQTVEQRFVGIEKADLTAVDLNGRRAQLSVRFVSQIISATLGRDGSIVDGDRSQIRDVTDHWTFERDISDRDPNWKLVATNAPA